THQVGFAAYLKKYRDLPTTMLPLPRYGNYAEPFVKTWHLNFEKVEQQPGAADLLRLSAFLNPDEIPFDLIVRGAAQLTPALATLLRDVEGASEVFVPMALEPIARYSLIRVDSLAETFSIHRLVQWALQDRMEQEKTWRKWA